MMVCSGARRSSDADALMGRSWLATRVMPALSDVADWAETTVLTRAQVSALLSCGEAEQPAAPSSAPAAMRTVRVFFMVYSGVLRDGQNGKDFESTAAAGSKDIDAAKLHLGHGVVEVFGDSHRQTAQHRHGVAS